MEIVERIVVAVLLIILFILWVVDIEKRQKRLDRAKEQIEDLANERRQRMRLIDADALLAEYDRIHVGEPGRARKLIEEQQTADVVARSAYDQVRWERDTAIAQLAEIGKGFGETMDDVVERKKGQWISITNRLPKEKQDVLLAYKHNMVVGFWENIMGEVTWYANNGDGWFSPAESVDNDGIPLAWMPLPDPYRKETEDAVH